MNLEFFASLTHEEAEDFLSAYLRSGNAALPDLCRMARAEGVDADLSIDSISPVLKWVLAQIKTIPKDPDNALPLWIQRSESYERGLFEFDDPSGVLVVRASYYLGAAFESQFSVLEWGIGNSETLETNMPVVTGFVKCIELAPIMVTENLFRRVLAGEADAATIDVAVESWCGFVPV